MIFKIIKYIGIIVLVILGITIGPSLAMGFGACACLGFIIIGGLDSIGLIKLPPGDNLNYIIAISFIIGFLIFIVISAI